MLSSKTRPRARHSHGRSCPSTRLICPQITGPGLPWRNCSHVLPLSCNDFLAFTFTARAGPSSSTVPPRPRLMEFPSSHPCELAGPVRSNRLRRPLAAFNGHERHGGGLHTTRPRHRLARKSFLWWRLTLLTLPLVLRSSCLGFTCALSINMTDTIPLSSRCASRLQRANGTPAVRLMRARTRDPPLAVRAGRISSFVPYQDFAPGAA